MERSISESANRHLLDNEAISSDEDRTANTLASTDRKEHTWQEALLEFQRTTDALGLRIDPGIMEPVVSLNVLGMNTIQSCEGHIDHGTGAPYIDVAAKDLATLEVRFQALWRDPSRKAEARGVRDEIVRMNLAERAKLMQQLDSFYRDRHVPYDQRLTIQSFGMGVGRIESQGAALQAIASEEIRRERLVRYQVEMHAFGRHLKHAFSAQRTDPSRNATLE